MFDYLFFIGRFQPFHNGHLSVVKEALKQTRKLIIFVGSTDKARSVKNPFTFEERKEMIKGALSKEDAARVIVSPLPDTTYNDDVWVSQVQNKVTKTILEDGNSTSPGTYIHGMNDFKVGIVGFSKDSSSYYLKLFPQFQLIEIPTQFSTINSTDIRKYYFNSYWSLNPKMMPDSTVSFLEKFTETKEFRTLVEESYYIHAYNPKDWPVMVVCVDNVVIQSGHILLVTRKNVPGKGLLALPGGHVNLKETLRDAAIRELKEETRIADEKGEIPPAMLASFIKNQKTFDAPDRSERARVITNAFLFKLPNREKLFTVRGDDDAENARWYELGKLNSNEFFEDHYSIIQTMIRE